MKSWHDQQSVATPSAMADHEITRLRQLLEESERRREEEQRRREEADRRREEEQRRREEADRKRDEAEILASAARPQTVPDYLESCHRLSLAIEIVTDKTLTTQGELTKPTGRKFPRRIIPWENFAASQEKTWNLLSADDAFFSDRLCPSLTQLDYVASLNAPISSEIGLRNFQRDTVENAVERLLTEVYNNPHLRTRLDMQGTVKFESHTNLGPENESISEHLENLTIDGATIGPTVPRRRAAGKGNRRADQFCIYRTESGRSYPSLAIEYKAPHKLSRDQIVAGLAAEIQPDRDVINKDGEGFDFESRRLCAAVVTQLFSYMVGLGTPYGYVCTGEVFIFLHIHPSDPSMVYYSVQVPNLDVMDDDETRLHRTAVSQVFAFVLRAIREEPPPQVWFDAAEALETWTVEYEKPVADAPSTSLEHKNHKIISKSPNKR
ncbi:phosphoglycerate mutase [Purpureocillium lavendulum]|uniref:Phosphoglycerate mutase n=1 Tax=Purpureocillium lavendulum TaxID=1247861 RepID=A0AB34FCS2_9HYPO|nr:phosphoglycerate mutase [Purpureocillium lavendulum]